MIPRLLVLFFLLASPWTGLAAPHADSLAQKWLQEAKAIPSAKVIQADANASFYYINKDLVINGTSNGPVSLVHGNLYVVGKVNGPISVVGGNVTVLGEVSGNVSVVGGELRVAGKIKGDTSVVGGGIVKDDQGTIEGSQTAHSLTLGTPNKIRGGMNFSIDDQHLTTLLEDKDAWTWIWVAGLCVGLVLMVCWGATSVLVTLIAPRALDEAARLFTRSPGRVWAVGLAFWVVFGIACVVALPLSFFLVGVPLLGVLSLIYFALRWFGLAALILWLGRRLWLALRGREPSLPSALMIGLLALGLLHMLPIVGVILWFVLMIPVAGVAVLWVIESRSSQPSAPAPSVAPEPPAAPPTEI